MLSKGTKLKLLLLLVLVASAFGVGAGNTSACNEKCVTISLHGVVVGHGCVSADGYGDCTASISACEQTPCIN